MPQITAIMEEFEKQSGVMNIKQEIMDDDEDDVLGESDDDEETAAIVRLVDQVFEELGLKLAEGMRALSCVYITQSRRGQPCSIENVVMVNWFITGTARSNKKN